MRFIMFTGITGAKCELLKAMAGAKKLQAVQTLYPHLRNRDQLLGTLHKLNILLSDKNIPWYIDIETLRVANEPLPKSKRGKGKSLKSDFKPR